MPEGYKIGSLNKRHTYWVFPIETGHADELITYLRANGFDASQKASSLIKMPNKDNTNKPKDLSLQNLVYLPMYPSINKKARLNLGKLMTDFRA